jgi:hypothetical protein
MDSNRFPWLPMDSYGFLWGPVDSYGKVLGKMGGGSDAVYNSFCVALVPIIQPSYLDIVAAIVTI